MSIESIQAIQACMLHLGLKLDKHKHKPVECKFSKHGGGSGLILVTFRNDVHSHQGPYLTFDETIRGFGIPFDEFKPAWQDFYFSKGEDFCSLICKGKDYAFDLTF